MAKLIKREERGSFFSEADGTAPTPAAAAPEVVDARTAAEQIRKEAEEAAQKVRDEAQAAAQKTHDEAKEGAEALRKAAHDEGFAKGREEGLAELVTATLAANARAQQILDEVVPQLTTLAMRICRRILGRELEFHPEAVVEIVKQALGDKARTRREITLRVHPDDAQMIRDSRKELVEMLARTKDIAIREDDKVAPHGVIIETEAGVIDAQLDTQLAVFEQLLGAHKG